MALSKNIFTETSNRKKVKRYYEKFYLFSTREYYMGSKLLMAGKNISNFYCWETTSFNAMKYKLLLNNEYLTFHELCETLLHIK